MLVKIFTFIILICFCQSKINPVNSSLSLIYPNISQLNKSLKLRFSLEDSPGFSYSQYLGVQFPFDANKNDFKMFHLPIPDTIDTPRFDCYLEETQGFTTRSIKVKSVLSKDSKFNNAKADGNIAFCKLDDLLIQQSVNLPSVVYTLTIDFKLAFDFMVVRTIGLLIVTSNTPDKIILDQNQLFGNLAQYNNFLSSNVNPLKIENLELLDLNNCSIEICENLFIYDSLIISIDFYIQENLISIINDYNMIIELPIDIISGNSVKITTNSVNRQGLILTNEELKLNGPLIANNLGLQIKKGINPSIYIIDNINEEFIKGRRFNIRISGFSLLPDNNLIAKSIKAYIVIRNTYSIISYDSRNTIQANRLKLFYPKSNIGLTGINHPEYWDIYANSAWPIKFHFQINKSINSDSYFVIQHANSQKNVNEFNFIASTCDFSENETTINQEYGKRPICYPLKKYLDFESYYSTSNDTYLGSGIFFKMNNIIAEKLYIVTVWGFADACSADINKTNNPTLYNNRGSFTILKFVYSVYKDINEYSKDDYFKNKTILAQSSPISMYGKCWNTAVGDSNLVFGFAMIKNSSWIDLLSFKEITNFDLGSTNVSTCNDCILNDVSKYTFPKSFIYSSNDSNKTSNSFFLLQFEINMNKGIGTPGTYIPTPFVINDNVWQYVEGRLSVLFSRQWFQAGQTNCHFSWANSIPDQQNQSDIDHKILIIGNYVNNLNNFISTSDETIDSNLTNTFLLTNDERSVIPKSIPKSMRITSVNNKPISDGTRGTKWSFLYDSKKNFGNNNFKFYFFSNCVRNNFPIPTTLKNIYSYYEVQVQWKSVNDYYPDGIVTKNTRFIKLFPELGVFNDNDKLISQNDNNSNFYIYFSDLYDSSICLVEIDGKALNQMFVEGKTDTIMIKLSFVMLYEQDYNDLTSNYPCNNISQNLSIHGYTSSFSISKYNNYVDKNPNLLLEFFPGNSSYHWFLGSSIIISKITSSNIVVTTNSIVNNLIFPIYCPVKRIFGNIGYNIPNMIIFSFSSNQKYDSNSSPVKYMTFDNKINLTPQITSQTNFINNSSLSFNGLMSENSLRIINGTKYKPSLTDNNCKALSLVFSDEIQILNNPELQFLLEGAVNLNTPNNNTVFYINGVKFSKFYSLIFPTTKVIIKNSLDFKINQVKKIELSQINVEPYNIRKFHILSNTIGFSCISNESSSNIILTNFVNYLGENFFYVDFVSDSNSTLLDFSIKLIDEYPYFSRDNGSGVNIKFKLFPGYLKDTIIKLDSSQFTKNTICGFNINSESINYECNRENENIITNEINCSIQKDILVTSNINIICYNVLFDISSTSEVFYLNSMSIFKNYGIFSDFFNSNYFYSNSIDNRFQISNPTSLQTIKAIISEIEYSFVEQNLGYGKMEFTIDLKRKLSRNFRIILNGNIKAFFIQNIIPTCNVYFQRSDVDFLPKNSNLNISNNNKVFSLDSLINECFIDEVNSKVVITISNQLIDNKLIFESKLKFSLFPVKQRNLIEIIDEFNISIVLSNGELLINNQSPNFQLPLYKNTFRTIGPITEFSPSNIQNPINQIFFYHGISNFLNILTIKINFKKIKENPIFSRPENNVNEFCILFNNPDFIINSNLSCYDDISDNEFGCDYNNKILRILIPNFLEKDEYEIKFNGIIYVNNNSNKNFLIYTLNNVNPNTGERYQVYTGLQNFNFESFNNYELIGNLLIKNKENNNLFLREYSDYSFDIIFDFNQNYNISINLVSPVIMIEYPDYHLLRKNDLQAFVNLKRKNKNELEIIDLTLITNQSQFGNLIVIHLNKDIFIDKQIEYINIKLANILNPIQLISAFNIVKIKYYIGSLTLNKGFTNFSNLFNFIGKKLDVKINDFIEYTSGYYFSESTKKMILNIEQDIKGVKSTQTFKISPGRYFQFMPIISSNKIMNKTTIISISNNYFKLMNQNNVNSSNSVQNPLYIGTNCGTLLGDYLLEISSSNIMDFYSIFPVRINLKFYDKGKINLSVKENLEILKDNKIFGEAGFLNILFYILSEPNVDPFKIEWNGIDDDNKQNENSLIIPLDLKNNSSDQFTFYGTKSTSNKSFRFTVNVVNSCYDLQMKSLIIDYSKTTLKESKRPDLTSKFTYLDPELNTNNSGLTSIKFTFNNKNNLEPLNLYCSLTCKDSKYLSDIQILNQNFEESFNQRKFKSYIFADTITSVNFNNLYRGREYNLKCIAITTDFLQENRKNSTITMDHYYNISTDIKLPLKTKNPQDSYCFDIYSNNSFSSMFGNNLLNLCDSEMFADLYIANGCFSCALKYSDEIFSIKSFKNEDVNQEKICGLDELSTRLLTNTNINLQHLDKISNLRHRMLQNTTNSSNNTSNNTVSGNLTLSNISDSTIINTTVSINSNSSSNNSTINNSTINNSTINNSTINNSSSTNSSVPINNNSSSQNSSILYPSSTTRIRICTYQSFICDTNNILENSSLKKFEKFKNYLNTTYNNITFGPIFSENAANLPKVKNIQVDDFNFNKENTLVSYNLKNTDYLICDWFINSSLDTSPTMSQIFRCSRLKVDRDGITGCGQFKITPINTKFEMFFRNKLNPGIHNIWVICSHDLPVIRYYSNIESLRILKVTQSITGDNKIESFLPSEIDKLEVKKPGIPVISSSIIIKIELILLFSLILIYFE